MSPHVLISEVGPRDRLQSVTRTMPATVKFAWIEALHAAGVPGEPIYGMTPEAGLPKGSAQRVKDATHA
jgi:hydroxymethylglutaryl-CoA lyase